MLALVETTLDKMAHFKREWSASKQTQLTLEQTRLLKLVLNLNQKDAIWEDYAGVWSPDKVSGISEQKLLDLFRYDTSIHFSPAEKAMIHFAYLASARAAWVADLQLLRSHFNENVVQTIKNELAERGIELKKRNLRLIAF